MTIGIFQFKGRYSFLSNFYKSPICYRKAVYKTAEHLFQALKTRDSAIRKTIRDMGFPGEARKFGRVIDLRDDWEDVKDNAMLITLRLKFSQNPRLRKRLLGTNKRYLAEFNYWHDNYWGDCRCPKCRFIVGRNQLGKTLMQVRKELQENNDS